MKFQHFCRFNFRNTHYGVYFIFFQEIHWVPIHDYESSQGVLISDQHGHHVGRLNIDDSYVIGKVLFHTNYFYAGYKGRKYKERSGHRSEVKYQNILPCIHVRNWCLIQPSTMGMYHRHGGVHCWVDYNSNN